MARSLQKIGFAIFQKKALLLGSQMLSRGTPSKYIKAWIIFGIFKVLKAAMLAMYCCHSG